MRKSTLLITLFTILLTACNLSFLDVSDELADERDMEQVFSTPSEVRRFHTHLYTGIPNSMYIWWHHYQSTDNPWVCLSDELKIATGAFTEINGITVNHTQFGRWTDLYQLIRQANLFLENVYVIPKVGTADFLGESEVNELKAVARFFRAYFHYLLFEQYGPIPIMEESVSPSSPDLDFARNSVDEVVDFIYNELTDVALLLDDPNFNNQQRLAVPTKGVALAVRARLMMYAASPLFNGGFEEALALTNVDGKRLFPDHNPTKWQEALNACQEFIDYAANHYELHKEYNSDGTLNPDESVYQVHMKMNKELIFVNSTPNWHNNSAAYYPTRMPRGARGGTNVSGTLGVRQELVDAFFMRDGFTIQESPLYSEDGYSIAGDDPTGRTKPGDHRMFINREPRFYNTVFYNGRNWHIGNEQIWFNRGGNSDNSATFTARTGHLLYKRTNRLVYREAPHPSDLYQPSVVFRLAEFYLLYAEALNEVNPSDTRIIEYVDKIRERAGIPLLAVIKPEIIGDQVAQRDAIRHEMKVELCAEGTQRYFDGNRWMIAENDPAFDGNGGFGGDFYGMDMFTTIKDDFYKRTVVDRKVWHRRMYLYPIPLSEVQKSRVLVQNPLYLEVE